VIYLSACPNSKSELSYRLDVLDNISVLELALCSVLFDELGDTVRDVEFVRVRVLGLVSSESFDGSVSVLIECLYYQLASKRHEEPSLPKGQARPLRQLPKSSSEQQEGQQLL